MSTTARKPGAGPGGGAFPAVDAARDVLEQLGPALRQCGGAERQTRLTLEAVREALGADVVFWHPGPAGGASQQAGSPLLPAAWRADFVGRVLGGSPGAPGPVVRSFLDPGSKPVSPWPCSAALVCVSKAQGVWLAALSFHPRRLFGAADAGVMRLVLRMVLAHRRRAPARAERA